MDSIRSARHDAVLEMKRLQHCIAILYESYVNLLRRRGDRDFSNLAQLLDSPDFAERVRAITNIINDLECCNLRSDSATDFAGLEAARLAWYRIRELLSAALPYNILARKFNNLLESAPSNGEPPEALPFIMDPAGLSNDVPVRFIGVAGPSCAGKSTAIQALSTAYDFVYLPADHFFRKQAAEKIYGYDNWEIPASLMLDELYRCMTQLKRGEPALIPSGMFTEDFSTLVYPGKVVVVDGFLLFTVPRIRELLDVRVFIDVAPEVQLERRILKTSEKRRDYIQRVVVPMYEKHRGAIVADSHFILDGNADRDTVRRNLRRVFRESGVFGN